MKKQPAQRSYVFEKGYRDIARTFKTTWGNTLNPVMNEMDRLGRMFSNGQVFMGIVTVLVDLIVFTAITLFYIVLNLIISILVSVAFLSVAPIVYVSFIIVFLIDLSYRTFRKISSHCPNCQYKFDLPVYICPNCQREHTRLLPSKYGIIKRKCDCGKKIPTTFFNGRQKLESKCPHCGCNIRDGGEHVDICIPVIGGPSAGKTCYINMAISQLEKSVSKKLNLCFSYVSNGMDNYDEVVRAMKDGLLPDKTGDMRLKYFQFYLTPVGQKLKNLISICDIGGEVYQDNNMLGNQIGYRYANGFIMVIDPLSIKDYRIELSKSTDIMKYRASTVTIDEILNRLVSVLENMFSVSTKTLLKTDVAIVFTKCDIPGLSEVIGPKAIKQYIYSNPTSSVNDACNMLCEKFLLDYNESNFVNGVKSKFGNVQYFTCSSLGYSSHDSPFVPEDVEKPVLWLLNRLCGINNY